MLAPPAPVSAAAQRRTLLTVSASTLLVLITFVTPLATGIRTAAALGAGTGGQAWLLSAMSVGLAAALLVAGEAADQLGRRRIFVAGLVLLGVGAAISGLSGSTGAFLAGRLLEGLGGAGVLACSLGLLSAAFPPGPSRANAMAGWGASVGAGTGLGGMLTVLLDPGTGWRTTYLVTAALAFVLGASARLLLPDLGARARRRVDVVGPVLLVAALGLVLVGLVGTRSGLSTPGVVAFLALGIGLLVVFVAVEARLAVPLVDLSLFRVPGFVAALGLVLVGLVGTRSGLGAPGVVAFLALGIGLLVVFVAVEARLAVPLVDLSLFRVPGFVAASLGALVTGAAVVGPTSFLATVLQRALGDGLLTVALLVLAWSAVSTVTALSVRWLPPVDGRLLLAGGLAVSAVGLAALAVLQPDGSSLRVLPGLVVLGIGYGAANASLGREAVAHVPAERAAMGSGANNTARYVGAAVGVTVVVLIVASGTPAGTPAGLASGWNSAALAGAAVAAAGALAVLLIRPRRTGPAVSDAVEEIAHPARR